MQYRMTQPLPAGLPSARPAKIGNGWRIVIELEGERRQYVGGFESERAAEHWIANELSNWINARWPKL
jgi:hypothetical protein